MVSVEVCVGSACHVKGSYAVVSKLQELVSDNSLEDLVEVKAAFCFGNCAKAVSVQFSGEDAVYSVAPDSSSVKTFFNDEVLTRTATA